MDPRVLELLAEVDGLVLFLTGAGISAESGIPTFRGPEGYWRVGSTNYLPMQLATAAAFGEMPDEVWGWYLYRRAVCRAARPNEAHRALVDAERALGDRFLLATQNVDGLHLRAGNSAERTYQIHGNIDFMRCAAGCSGELFAVPEVLDGWEKGRTPGDRERALLSCPRCGGRGRPHVLWFDEYYDETWFRFESSQRAASRCALLVVVGTSGATNLPSQMCDRAFRNNTPMIVVDPDDTPFADLARRGRGAVLRGGAVAHVPEIVRALVGG
jgi:NAD-dependent deacetylase